MGLDVRVGRSRLVSTLIAVTVVSVLAFFQNCGKGFSSMGSEKDEGSSSLSSVTAVVAGNSLLINAPAAQMVNLGTKTDIAFTLTAGQNYHGRVGLELDSTGLAAIDPGGAITATFSPTSVTLVPGQSAQIVLTLNVSTMAPSFAMTGLKVHAINADTGFSDATSALPLQVRAIYDLNILPGSSGAKPEIWSTAPGSVTSFISHPEGLMFHVNNLDSTVHLIHSSGGPIPHESTTALYPGTNTVGLPASADGGKTAGGVYANVVPGGATQMTSQLYCHLHEAAADLRTFQFNVPSTVTRTNTGSGNPNAKYSYLSANVFQARCVSCHGASNPASGVNLSTYAGVSAVVSAGSASSSALYLAVKLPNPSMPLTGGPLTADQVQDIQDWIDDGAANN